MEHLSTLSDLELADLITTWSGRMAAGEARLLAYIGEFDEREAWGGPGLLSCAHWLTWKTGLSAGAAREKVRVARAFAGGGGRRAVPLPGLHPAASTARPPRAVLA